MEKCTAAAARYSVTRRRTTGRRGRHLNNSHAPYSLDWARPSNGPADRFVRDMLAVES
jgi:hypothetical protein